jgi:diadenosine tetraphosphate (Ap4A) HIT family hydrolase
MGYEIRVDDTTYYAWMNPFPLLPRHLVVATQAHTSQEWGVTCGARLDRLTLLSDLAALATRMPGFIGYYNGVGAGASIAGHMHLHFCQRPEGHPEFPLERAAKIFARGDHGVGLLTGYPVAAAVWRGAPAQVVKVASDWLSQWTHRNRARLASLTCNLIVTNDWTDDGLSLYFVPRDRSKSRVEGLNGLIGGVEILGEVVLSTPEEKKLLDDGAIDYFALENYLSRVYTPMFAA